MKILTQLIVFLTVVISPCLIHAEWIPLGENTNKSTKPNVEVLSDDVNQTIIKIDISGFELHDQFIDGEIFQSIDLLTDVFTTKVGSPRIPCISEIIAVPDDASITVDVIEKGTTRVFGAYNILPSRKSWQEGHEETPYVADEACYKSNQVFPKEHIQFETPVIFRDFRITRLSVYPIQYNPVSKELQIVESFTLRINYNKGEAVNIKTTPKKKIAPSFGKIYRSSILNYQHVLDREYAGKEEGHDVMLCVIPDEFDDSFASYATWKRQSGTDVHVTKFSDIGANANNPNIIKDHIADAYHNWDDPPTYVLLVGDDGLFPKKIVNYNFSFPNENFFVEIDGDDFFPEMMIGRFTNENDYILQVMINKFISYEKEPYVENTEWFKKGICCSNNLYESQITTKRFAANQMIEYGGFTSVDTLMSDGESSEDCSMDLEDVINAINDGRSFLNYRGEGWADGWYPTCYWFYTSDLASLSNYKQIPFVTGIGCGVAMFDVPYGNCFGEQWIEMGTLSDYRGAIAFIGPTSNTHTTYNNKIDKGIYVGMFQEGMETPGQAMMRGRLYLYNVYGGDLMVEYHYRVYCILGDPSVHIWKDVPMEVSVTHSSTVPPGYSQQEVTVTHTATGNPVVNAQVTFQGGGAFNTTYTDSEGKASLNLLLQTLENQTVTVRGTNVIPYQGTITVVPEDEYIAPAEHPIIVDIDGNLDGLLNPNENGKIVLTLKNWGNQLAENVMATFSVNGSDNIDIITSEAVSYGDIPIGASVEGEPFYFLVDSECPIGEKGDFNIHVETLNYSWDYSYSFEVKGCQLDYNSFLIDDTGSPLVNYRLEPGESAKLYVLLENTGEDFAPNVSATLRSNDIYIEVDDSIGTFGDIGIGDVKVCNENIFQISVDESCPNEYFANLILDIRTEGGGYDYFTSVEFSVPISNPVSTDITGPDSYGYYVFTNDDTSFEQKPIYNWVEIADVGTKIILPEQSSNYTETFDLPFTFKYYGIEYDQIQISTDGWVAFGGESEISAMNSALPCDDGIENMIAVFWDDLYSPGIETGSMYYYSDFVNHRFIVEWDHFTHHSILPDRYPETFQIVLLSPEHYETPTGDGEIIMQYKDLSFYTSNTVGIENNTEDIGINYVHNNSYAPTANELRNSLAIKYTTVPPTIIIPNEISTIPSEVGTKSSLQNYPNPFKDCTHIAYHLDLGSNVKIEILSLNGKVVKTFDKGYQQAGEHTLIWNGKGDNGLVLNSGVYIYRLKTESLIATGKMFLLK